MKDRMNNNMNNNMKNMDNMDNTMNNSGGKKMSNAGTDKIGYQKDGQSTQNNQDRHLENETSTGQRSYSEDQQNNSKQY